MNRKTVVVADDDDDLRALLCLQLQGFGYRIVEVRDGAALLELLAHFGQRKLDVIVADVLMPCYSGIGVLGALRGTEIDIPVIVITARQDEEIARDAIRLGAVAVFHKPFDIGDLRAAIERATKRRPWWREHREIRR